MEDLVAGVSDPTKVPEGMTPADIQDIIGQMADIGPDIDTATKAIDAQLKDECSFTMGDDSDDSGSTPESAPSS